MLTDEGYSQSKLEYIAQIKEWAKLPILRKDFIIPACAPTANVLAFMAGLHTIAPLGV